MRRREFIAALGGARMMRRSPAVVRRLPVVMQRRHLRARYEMRSKASRTQRCLSRLE